MINWQNELVFVVFVSEHAAVISLQESDPPPPQFITHPESRQRVRVPRPRRIHISVDTDMADQSSLSSLRCFCMLTHMFESSTLPFGLFCGGRIQNCIVISVCPQIHFISVFQPTHPHRMHSLPSLPSLSSVSQPPPGPTFFFFKIFALHTWVSWHKTPTHPAPPHFSIHKIIFDCRKHFLSERSFREQGRTNK